MSVIDDYLKKLEPSKRKQLRRIRIIAKKSMPDAEEVISYGIPTLKYRGKSILSFEAWKAHVGIYPHSARVVASLKDQLKGYETSKGTIRVPLDEPIPESLLKKIINCKLKLV